MGSKRNAGLGAYNQGRISRTKPLFDHAATTLPSLRPISTTLCQPEPVPGAPDNRHADSILLTPADWRVHLVDHRQTFGKKAGRPTALRKVTISPAPEFAAAIAALDETALREALDGLIDPALVKPILKRRKKLVSKWTKLGLLSKSGSAAGR